MDAISSALVPILLMILALIVALVVFVWIRRQFIESDADLAGEGFTLQQIREMRAQGKLTDEEYESARALILGQAGAGPTPPPTPDPDPETDPESDPESDPPNQPKTPE